MRKDYEKLFSHLEPPEPSAGLLNRIMKQIRREQYMRTLRLRFAFFIILLAASATAAVPAYRAMQSSIAESGFMQFLSLLFSDTGTVMAYWDSFVLTLLEALPVISIAVLLASIIAFLESLKFIIRNFKTIFTPLNANS